jgi:biopolymer transport protein ExbB
MPTLFNLIRGGGWMMVPIFIASLFTIALIFEHSFTVSRGKKHLNWLWQYPAKKDQLLLKKSNDIVVQYVIEAEEEQLGTWAEKNHLAGQLVLSQERRISWLGTIAAIAPLLGLLGTVSGMISIFFTIAGAPPKNPLGELSSGISEALVSTAGGLVVAIVAALGQHFIMNSLDDLAMDLEAWLKENEPETGGKTLAHQAK